MPNRERVVLRLLLRVATMSSVVGDSSLKSDVKSLLREVCTKCGTAPRNHSQSKAIAKEVEIEVQNSSEEHGSRNLGWSEDDSDDEEVSSMPAAEAEIKLRVPLEKEVKKCFENWREFARGTIGQKNF